MINTTTHGEGIYIDAPRGILIPGVDQVVLKIYANAGNPQKSIDCMYCMIWYDMV